MRAYLMVMTMLLVSACGGGGGGSSSQQAPLSQGGSSGGSGGSGSGSGGGADPMSIEVPGSFCETVYTNTVFLAALHFFERLKQFFKCQ